MTTLHTERLILRPWEMSDFEAFAAMSAEPEVMQFLSPDGKPLTRFQAWQSKGRARGGRGPAPEAGKRPSRASLGL